MYGTWHDRYVDETMRCVYILIYLYTPIQVLNDVANDAFHHERYRCSRSISTCDGLEFTDCTPIDMDKSKSKAQRLKHSISRDLS